jgi:hypothetical protein
VTGAAGSPADRAAALADAARAGDRRALARLLTAVENHTAVAEHALRRLHPLAGAAHLVGITGPPGAGKSTLVAALIAELRAAGRTVAVVAVDPSSPITGGALLGDRVRMQSYASDDGVFIRSMASRGHAGGLAATSTTAATVFDAAGFDTVLLETVGTGQSEVEARPPACPRDAIDRMNTASSPAYDCIRTRSPRSAPPVIGEDGSTATTATVRPALRSSAINAATSVDLPAPGGPVIPTRCAAPASG